MIFFKKFVLHQGKVVKDCKRLYGKFQNVHAYKRTCSLTDLQYHAVGTRSRQDEIVIARYINIFVSSH